MAQHLSEQHYSFSLDIICIANQKDLQVLVMSLTPRELRLTCMSKEPICRRKTAWGTITQKKIQESSSCGLY